MIVTLKDGNSVAADTVIRSTMYPVLHIYTSQLTFSEAGELFSDPAACEEITVTDDYDQTKIYHDFTVLYSIQKAQLYQNKDGTEILIWMQRPQEDYD